MTEDDSVKEDQKDSRSVETHSDPDDLLRGLNSEDQKKEMRPIQGRQLPTRLVVVLFLQYI